MRKSERRCRLPQKQDWPCFLSKGKMPLRANGHVGNGDGPGPNGDSRKSGSPLRSGHPLIPLWRLGCLLRLYLTTCRHLSTVLEEGNRRGPRESDNQCYHRAAGTWGQTSVSAQPSLNTIHLSNCLQECSTDVW